MMELRVISGSESRDSSGKIMVSVGANGCGKSTLLVGIGTVVKGTGTVYLDSKIPFLVVPLKKCGKAIREFPQKSCCSGRLVSA